MSQSASKRRRLDNSQLGTVYESVQDDRQPTTPTRRRASYLSPTKTSLARSHPHLVPASTRRSATEPRGKALRDDILGSKSQELAPKTVSRTHQSHGLDGTDDTINVQFDGAASATEVDRSTTNPQASDTVHERLPLKERQPAQNRRRERRVSNEGPSQIILPKLVSRKGAAARSVDRARSGEPELPPTPVELGLSAPPERPRGLASSSSPRGSKMSSGSRRRRTRSGGPVTSSPLKPKARPPLQPDDRGEEAPADDALEAPESDREEDAQDAVEEALESDPEVTQQADGEESTEVQERRSTLELLRKQLNQLRQDNQQLQKAIDNDGNLNEDTLKMLRQSAIGNSSLPIAQSANDTNSAYLKLFAPANLQLSSRTETKIIRDRTKIIHILQIQAPAPWLPNSLSCVFEVAVDTENIQIENVEMKDAMMAVTRRNQSTRAEIHRWVQSRSEDPLHRLDVSGMVWGMGRWLNAAIERARVFRWIDLKYNRSPAAANPQKGDKDEELTREVCIELARYLDSTQNSALDAELTISAGGKRSRKKLMLHWQINIDWAGGLTSDIQISTSGIPQKAEPGLKSIFCGLIPKAGVKGAFQSAWSLMHTDAEEFQYVAKKGKRKRGKE